MEQDPDAGAALPDSDTHLQPHHYDAPVPHTIDHILNTTTQPPLAFSTGGISHQIPIDIDADDFYKGYQPTATVDGGTSHMTSIASSRLSNGGGNDTNLRSAAGPVVDGGLGRSSGSLSVKDLTKRFNQKDGPPIQPRPLGGAVSPSQPQSPSLLPHPTHPSHHHHQQQQQQQINPDSTTNTRRRAGSTSLARLRTAATSPDYTSSSQSFANRINNPQRNGDDVSSQIYPPPPSLSTSASASGLLFGEILPEQSDNSTVGHGIQVLRPRRISESSVMDFARPKPFSDLDAQEPASPSSWYRGADAQPVLTTSNTFPTNYSHPNRTRRSQSDAVTSQFPPSSVVATGSAGQSSLSSSTSTLSSKIPSNGIPSSSSTSKLPVSIRRLHSSPISESTPSSRASSPHYQHSQNIAGFTHTTNHTQTRPKTPTSRAKTPTRTARERRPPPPSLNPAIGTSKSQNPAASKTMPSPRTTRQRQPVTVATTASSRMKETDKASTRSGRTQTRNTESQSRRRLVSIGPIDFEQRREHIRLAYTKSIRESQALEVEVRQKRELEIEQAKLARAMAKASKPHTPSSPTPEMPGLFADLTPNNRDKASNRLSIQSNSSQLSAAGRLLNRRSQSERKGIAEGLASTLTISTALASAHGAGRGETSRDSPTFGVPGAFPAYDSPGTAEEDIPQSATSAVTEFDIEPQVDIESQDQMSSSSRLPASLLPNPNDQLPIHQPAEYQYPFSEEPESSYQRKHAHKVSDATIAPSNSVMPAAAPSRTFTDDYEESLSLSPPVPTFQSYETTVTILSSPSQLEPPTMSRNTLAVPFPRLSMHDESDCYSEFDDGNQLPADQRRGSDGATTDACTEGTDDNDGLEDSKLDFYDSRRASTCESSETGASMNDTVNLTFEHRFRESTSGAFSLSAPRTQTDRFSHQSGWTDYSIGSADYSDMTGHSQSRNSTRQSYSYSNNVYTSPSSPLDGSFPRDGDYRDQNVTGSLDQMATAGRDRRISASHLAPQASQGSSSHVPSPSHDPPPIPASASGSALNSKTSSVFYDQSLNSSTQVTSQQDSQESLSYAAETPQSMETASLETGDQENNNLLTTNSADAKTLPPDGGQPSGKERQRLVQRRNIIKELVDTEAVFVRDMNIVEEIYKGTAEACPKLDDQTVKLIFRNSTDIIAFHTTFLAELKDAVSSVYIPKGGRSKQQQMFSPVEASAASRLELSDEKDREVAIGPVFLQNTERLKAVHENFLRNSDHAAKRLIQIQQDSTVKVWLMECNEVAKDLTAAWDLDSLLIKPMQRITKYPNLIITLLQHMPPDHPDRESLTNAKDILENAIVEINKTKKNFELVGQIVGRKRKESDVKTGLARAFGKRVDKLQASSSRPAEDPVYAKLHEKFGDDYLRLQVVLRDVEFYTRQVSDYVHEFLQFLSSIELVMRLQPGNYPELESKWVQFNISMRDLEKVVLEEHLAQVRKGVIEPFEQVIKAYGNPSLAMKKRQKRRLDYERVEQLKRSGKTPDSKLRELVEQYDALNDTLTSELPKLSSLTERVGNICLGNFVNIQTNWYRIWKDRMKLVLGGDTPDLPDLEDVVATFQQDFPYASDQVAAIGILDPAYRGRASQSTATSTDDPHRHRRSRTVDGDRRARGISMNEETAPSLPTTSSGKRHSGSVPMSPSTSTGGVSSSNPPISLHQYYYRDYYAGSHTQITPSASQNSSFEASGVVRSNSGTGFTSTRPSTSRSIESSGAPRQSNESNVPRRDSNTTYDSSFPMPENSNRFSNMFHSALPATDNASQNHRSSHVSISEPEETTDGYNVLWLAASLFEFNIMTTKHEAGYPYLTYQAGEIFDVIAEKGELWLAKNQDDQTQQVGWIWSKHFARLADS